MRISLLLFTIGILLMTHGYVQQKNPQCKDEVQVRVIPRDVYDHLINEYEIPKDIFQ